MTELELYKFINDNNVEWRKQYNGGIQDVLIFPNFTELEEFARMTDSYTADCVFSCILKGKYVSIFMREICEYYGIKIGNVFDLKEQSNDKD